MSDSDETVVVTVKGDSVELGMSSEETVVETVKDDSVSVLELRSTEEELTTSETVVLDRTERAWQRGRATTPENNDWTARRPKRTDAMVRDTGPRLLKTDVVEPRALVNEAKKFVDAQPDIPAS